MEGASVRGADRAPLIDLDAEEEAGADPNILSWLDWAWLWLHLAGASGDALAMRALLRRRFKGALFFGGHTQFLGNWSLCLSIGTHGHCCPQCPAPLTQHSAHGPHLAPCCTLPAHMPGACCARASLRRVCACVCAGHLQPAMVWPYTQRWSSRRRQRCTTPADKRTATASTAGRPWSLARW
jgi:hypothetical protein